MENVSHSSTTRQIHLTRSFLCLWFQHLGYSATFTVGRPKFGSIFTLPDTDKNAHIGESLKTECGGKLRKDPFKAYKCLIFTEFVFNNRGVPIPFEPPAANVPVSKGEITVEIP
ncbi:10372_t:CDS:2 [Paraglomus occultum]|uniref:10372_t:CDS:1 n=1 Tax=Paraglomus occultum TaxID=144539 RepID=A0A9N9BJ38_9GLOM|nr:10372_t:CDS:2 [Paraglomus occultum]